MTDLAGRIVIAIRRNGPMSLERFWNIALFDRDGGYYTRGKPIGEEGDFTTAPEISQMFGELVGAWLVAAWRGLGRPTPFALAEFGPGRGTLMADILRTIRRLDLDCLKAARVRLVETSDRLAAEQIERLAPFDLPVVRARRFAEIEGWPLLLVANELFDAVAIRQYVRKDGAWCERLVGLDEEGLRFRFRAGPPLSPQPRALPGDDPAEGEIFEASPLRQAIAAEIGAAVARRGGAALVLDYGHARSGFGDTLQALHRHRYADPLREPGHRDITSHVDFQALAEAFGQAGALVSPTVGQGPFLLSLGLRERAGTLGRDADEEGRQAIRAAVRRLAGDGPGEMGSLFKVLAVASAPLALPPFEGSARSD